MKTAIIDIGTKSIKHYIFEGKKEIYFHRDSSIKIGEEILQTNKLVMEKALEHLQKCVEINKEHSVDKLVIVGTDAIRKADNSLEFKEKVKEITGAEIEVITHEKECELLGKGFAKVAIGDCAIFNCGGGSIELAILKEGKMHSFLLPFGVNKLYQEFLRESYEKEDYHNLEAWKKCREFLQEEMLKVGLDKISVPIVSLTGVYNFAWAMKDLGGLEYSESEIEEHPIKVELEKYSEFQERLKELGVKKLGENYPQDPNYSENFCTGQEIYITAARLLRAKYVYPSEFQYVHGLI